MSVSFSKESNLYVSNCSPKNYEGWLSLGTTFITYDPITALKEDPTCIEARCGEAMIVSSHTYEDEDSIDKLRPYQSAGVKLAMDMGRGVLLADEMGLGKTIQALTIINLKYRPSTNKIIVVTPASVLYNWKSEAMKWLPLWVMSKSIEFITYNRLVTLPKNAKYDCVIFDEAHYLKNDNAQRSKQAFRLSRRCGFVMALTGTPMPNRHKEILPLLLILDIVKPRHESYFRRLYTYDIPDGYGGFKYNDGSINSISLNNFLRSTCMIRRSKDDVLKQLPPKLKRAVILELGTEIKKLSEYQINIGRDVKLLPYDELGGGELSKYLHDLGVYKIPYAIRHIREVLDTEKKVIVFGWHKDVLHALRDEFKGCAFVDGAVTPKKRQEQVHRFQNEEDCRVFIGNYRAAGEGITLTASRYVVLVEPHWSPSVTAQAEDRAHRIGQKCDVIIDYLLADHTLDMIVARTSLNKEQITTEATGSTRTGTTLNTTEEGEDMSIENEILNLVKATRENTEAILVLTKVLSEGAVSKPEKIKKSVKMIKIKEEEQPEEPVKEVVEDCPSVSPGQDGTTSVFSPEPLATEADVSNLRALLKLIYDTNKESGPELRALLVSELGVGDDGKPVWEGLTKSKYADMLLKANVIKERTQPITFEKAYEISVFKRGLNETNSILHKYGGFASVKTLTHERLTKLMEELQHDNA